MGAFVPIVGPILGATVRVDGKLVARDVNITLPEVAPLTADISVMGTFSMPIWQLIEHMEATFTKIGMDMGLSDALSPDMKPLEVRWAQPVADATGSTKNVGCKCFLRGIPANLPEIGLEVGSTSEHEVRIALTRYNLFVDGKEAWNIDRLAGIVRINGKSYSDFESML